MTNPYRAAAALSALLMLLAPATCVAADDVKSGAESQGWTPLFNGKDLAGWTPKIKGYPLGENYGDTFRVEDGKIVVRYDKYEGPFRGRFGHLFYKDSLSNYRLKLEYRFVGVQAEKGPEWALRNSGVMIHGQKPDSIERDQDFPVSLEVQLLGGDGVHPRTTGNLCTPGTNVVYRGKLHTDHCTPSSSDTYHGEQWVACEVEVHGGRLIRHKINGKTVFEYSEPQLDPEDAGAKRLIDAGAETMLTGGTISLQSESHPVEFRNILLLPLD